MIDQTVIFVRSGKGGDGCVSLRREKFIPKGGPDGGDGGKGGDVVLVVDASVDTLLPLTPRPHYRAANGQQGRGTSQHGADGDDRRVAVPVGTLVYDRDSGELLVDMCEVGQTAVIARGGAGGFGNEHFKSATNQTPRTAIDGEPWEERALRLELKLMAQVGLIGLPNAGKSTLLKTVTAANPKVASYPFTTLSPNLGVAMMSQERTLLLADIPGLIEGAAQGAGLGHTFLRHIERTQVLVHLVDGSSSESAQVVDNYRAVRGELNQYSPDLAGKHEIVVVSKIDLIPEPDRMSTVQSIFDALSPEANVNCLAISCAAHIGLEPLLEQCWASLGEQGAKPSENGWSVV